MGELLQIRNKNVRMLVFLSWTPVIGCLSKKFQRVVAYASFCLPLINLLIIIVKISTPSYLSTLGRLGVNSGKGF